MRGGLPKNLFRLSAIFCSVGLSASAEEFCPLQLYPELLPPLRPALYLDGRALGESVLASLSSPLGNQKFFLKGPTLPRILAESQPLAYLDSGREMLVLKEWVLRQPLFSVTPLDFFRKALEISGRDASRALALSWNYLSEESKSRGIERNVRENILRLVDLTGELVIHDPVPVGGVSLLFRRPKTDLRGDNFSAWYHFFGTAIYEFARMTTMRWLPPSELALRVEHATYAGHVVYQKKRSQLELAGAYFARVLSESLSGRARNYQARSYLYDRADFYSEEYVTRREEKAEVPRCGLMQKALFIRVMTETPEKFELKDWCHWRNELAKEAEPSVAQYLRQRLEGRDRECSP